MKANLSDKTQSVGARSFTLVEILAVVLLIAMLAVFVVPPYLNKVSRAKAKVAKPQIMAVDSSLGMFYQDCDRYPTQSEGLSALLKEPSGLAGKWHGPYCKESQLVDPWNNSLVYMIPGNDGRAFDVISYGQDGTAGGEDLGADIYNN